MIGHYFYFPDFAGGGGGGAALSLIPMNRIDGV